MQSVLHNHWLHIGIVCLVALDAFIVIFELLLDVGAFGMYIRAIMIFSNTPLR